LTDANRLATLLPAKRGGNKLEELDQKTNAPIDSSERPFESLKQCFDRNFQRIEEQLDILKANLADMRRLVDILVAQQE
jgi:hypothetical protein